MSLTGKLRERVLLTATRVNGLRDIFVDFDVAIDNTLSDAENLAVVEDDLYAVSTTMEIVEAQLNVLYECHSDWRKIVETLVDEEKQAEVKLREDFERDQCQLTALLDELQGLLDKYKQQRTKLLKAQRELQRKIPVDSTPPTPPPRGSAAAKTSVRLPQIELPKYGGSIVDFRDFWDMFTETVDTNPDLGDRQRFAYLKSCLIGRAQRTISGIQETEKNYPIAKQMLKDAFGKDEVLKQVLYDELRDLKRPDDKLGSLRTFQQDLELACRQLESMGENVDHANVVGGLEKKIPGSAMVDLVRAKKAATTWNTAAFRQFLDTLIEEKEAVDIASGKRSDQASTQAQPPKAKGSRNVDKKVDFRPSGAFAVTQQRSRTRPECFLCGEAHWANNCVQFPTAAKRRERAAEARLCFKCLQPNHACKDCPRKKGCPRCEKNHHLALCLQPASPSKNALGQKGDRGGRQGRRPKSSSATQGKSTVAAVQEEQKRSTSSSDRTNRKNPEWIATSSPLTAMALDDKDDHEGCNGATLLTNEAVVQNPKHLEKEKETTLFYDSGSQTSFILKALAQELQLPKKGSRMFRLNTLTTGTPKKMRLDRYQLDIVLKDGSSKSLVVYALDRLVGEIEAVQVRPVERKRPDGKQWLTRVTTVEPEILVGNDYYFDFGIVELERLKNGTRVLDSATGFIATAASTRAGSSGFPLVSACSTFPVISIDNDTEIDQRLLDRQVEEFWLLQSLGFMEDARIQDDEVAQEILLRTLKHVNGRYRVRMPWNTARPDLPRHYKLAWRRLASLIARLLREPELLKQYDTIIQQQILDGVLEIVTDPDLGNLIHYIPHHPVFSEGKTTRLRIVLDASAKGKGERSLNDNLLRGPCLLPELPGLGLRHRTGKVILMGDVRAAYHQLEIDPQDRDAFRILWLKDPSKGLTEENLLVLRAARVIFGAKPSSYLLSGTIQEHLRRTGTPLATQLMDNTYSDNVVLVCETEDEAIEKMKETDVTFQQAGMHLRSFISNSSRVNDAMGSKDLPPVCKFLGVSWRIPTDELLLLTPETLVSGLLTKRQVLRQLMSIFDPQGLLTPVTFQAKCHFQKVFKTGIEWDVAVSDELRNQWSNITSQWGHVEIAVKRLVIRDRESRFELHATSDASGLGCGIAVYLRELHSDGTISCHLVFAKSRLAPIKNTPTIPRLELVAAILGLRVLMFVLKNLHLLIRRLVLWCDSKITIGWLSRDLTTLPLFIRNRVEEFRRHPEVEVGYIPTKDNPSDAASRGLSLQELRDHHLWWTGPTWWTEEDSKWIYSCSPIKEIRVAISQEAAGPILTGAAGHDDQSRVAVLDASRLSKFERHRNVATCVLRVGSKWLSLIGQSSEQPQWNALQHDYRSAKNVDEVLLGRRLAIVQDQVACPPTEEEIERHGLRANKNGILTCHDRLAYSGLPFETKHCVFLAKKSPLLELMVLHVHEKNDHSGIQLTLSVLRQTFWFPQGKRTVRSVIRRRCMQCRRLQAKAYRTPIMPPLPLARTSRAPCFCHSGLDFLGPITVRWNWKQGGTQRSDPMKIWVLLVVCMSSRAVALYVVQDLSTESFLLAFRQFVAEHGKPRLITSDNATTYTLASKVVNSGWHPQDLDPEIECYLNQEEIRWIFIPANTPWMGGHYERLVASVKKAFSFAAGRRVLDYQETVTALKEIAGILNQRPLAYVHDEGDSAIIRPIDFLKPDHNPPAGVFFDDSESDEDYRPAVLDSREKALKTWKTSKKTSKLTWEKLYPDVLMSLRERTQWLHKQKGATDAEPRLDEVVMILDKDYKKGFWKHGRIVGLNVSHDGAVRTAEVQLPNGWTTTQPVSKLFPLEINERDDEVLRAEQNNAGPDVPSKQEVDSKSGELASKPEAENERDVHSNEGSLPARRKLPIDVEKGPSTDVSQEPAFLIGDTNEQTSGSKERRYPLRQRKPVNFVWPALLSLLMLQIGSAHGLKSSSPARPAAYEGRQCPAGGKLYPLRSHRCVNKGTVVYRNMADQSVCYEDKMCPDGKHLQMSRPGNFSCGEPCQCEGSWTMGCSDFHGKATFESQSGNQNARRILKSLWPNFCGLQPTTKCWFPTSARLFQVQLFDDSVHFVRRLDLVHDEYHADDVNCFGNGTDITGSRKYCETYPCRPNGTRFCWYPYPERVYLQSKVGELLIKAWGVIHTTVYVSEYVPRPAANTTFQIQCKPYGFLVKSEQINATIEVCCSGICVRKAKPKEIEEIRFPPQYLLQKHHATMTVWQKGQVVSELEQHCTASDLCSQIDCVACPLLLRNPQCVTTSTVAVIAIIVYFVSFVMFTITLLKVRQYRRKVVMVGNSSSPTVETTTDIALRQLNHLLEEQPLLKSDYEDSEEAIEEEAEYAEDGYEAFEEARSSSSRTPSVVADVVENSAGVNQSEGSPSVKCSAPRPSTRGTEEEYQYWKTDEAAIEAARERVRLSKATERRRKQQGIPAEPSASVPSSDDSQEGKPKPLPRRFGVKLVSSIPLVMIVSLICSLTSLAAACDKTTDIIAATQMCYEQSNGKILCNYDQTVQLVVGDTQRQICLTWKDSMARVMGTATFEVSTVELVCNPLTLYHTRQFEIDVASSRRCFKAGSCRADQCASTKVTDLIQELEGANQFPGLTYCRNAAGCWSNGCFYCSDACVFYRVFSRPVTPLVGEVYQCAWTPRLQIVMTLQEEGKEPQEKTLLLTAAASHTEGSISASVASMSLPPLPPLEQRFVSDGVRVATVSKDHRRILQCDTNWDAISFKPCKLLQNPCGCGPAGDVAVCDCAGHPSEMDALNETSTLLPRHIGNVWMTNNRSIITAEAAFTEAQIQLTFRNMKLEVTTENNTCTITPLELTGCHGCGTGATFEFTCETDFGSALTEVTCETMNFTAHCDSQGQHYRHHFLTENKLLKETCVTSCPGGRSSFVLEGALSSFEGKERSPRHISGEANSNGFHLDDVWNFFSDAWNFICNSVLLWDLKVWAITIAVVVVGTVGLIVGFNYLQRNHPDAIRPPGLYPTSKR
ncbi:Pao retrotransposon peptidase domain-containing protein [Aphelenchoides avenae]|nr:Pao retrotransposon peptidase domain-containing protein [Aphelenchus avenae]